jgi:hypothetical protein
VAQATIMVGAIIAVTMVLSAGPPKAPGKTSVDVCALLTSADVEAVLGDSVKERKPTPQPSGDLTTAHCFFATSSSRSVSLMLTTEGARKHGGLTPREYWRKQFHGDSREKGEEEGKERGSSPRRIAGLGDEAFWMGTRFAGALYVLRGQTFLRISVGGLRNEQERVEKSKALALAALKKLLLPSGLPALPQLRREVPHVSEGIVDAGGSIAVRLIGRLAV